jgi:hypothetical protein
VVEGDILFIQFMAEALDTFRFGKASEMKE